MSVARDAGAAPRKAAAAVEAMTDGELADEHRGQSFAKRRAEDRLKAIEAELTRRKIESARGSVSFVSKQLTDVGLLDIKRLRADLGDAICREYAIPGTNEFWRSRTLTDEERACTSTSREPKSTKPAGAARSPKAS